MTSLVDGLDEAERALVTRGKAAFVAPMLATLTQDRFTDPAWIFERKLDGVRAVAVRDASGAGLWSRTEKRMDATYPELVDAIAERVPPGTVLDGEIVAFDGAQTSFERLQGRIGLHDPDAARATGIAVYLYLFDLLVLDDQDVTRLPLRARKRLLRDAVDFGGPLRMSAHRNTATARPTCARRARRAGRGWSRSGPTRRTGPVGARPTGSSSSACTSRSSSSAAGPTRSGSRTGFGALLVGYYDGGRLRYAGKVGTGFDHRALADLSARFRDLAAQHPPFADPRAGEGRALGGAGAGRADRVQRVDPGRQAPPSPLPRAARRQATRGRRPRGARMTTHQEISRPGKVLFPDPGLTKADLAAYYERVADVLLPHLARRPLVLHRFPDGIADAGFFQKQASEGAPVDTVTVPAQNDRGHVDHVLVDDVEGLRYLANQAVVELHRWLSTPTTSTTPICW